MSIMGRIVERYKKNQIKREDMCLPDLKKQIKKRRWSFLIVYCACVILGYLGFALTYDTSQILSILFLSILAVMFTVISAMDFLYTRLLYYLKFNEE